MLKYLNTLDGFEQEFETANKFGVPPVLYAITNNQIFTFIYLAVKLSCELTDDHTKWAIKEMFQKGST